MSSREFESIIKALGDAVSFLFNLTIDIFLSGLLVISCILPYRIFFIQKMFSFPLTDRRYRDICFWSFLLTIEGMIICLLLMFVVFNPRRWLQICFAFQTYFQVQFGTNIDIVMDREYLLRAHLFTTFFTSVYDFFTLIVGFLVMISPFGRQIVCHNMIKAKKNYELINSHFHNGAIYDYSRRFSNHITIKNLENDVICSCGMSSLFDILIFMMSFLFILFVPSVWIGTNQGVQEIIRSIPVMPVYTPTYIFDDFIFLYEYLRTL